MLVLEERTLDKVGLVVSTCFFSRQKEILAWHVHISGYEICSPVRKEPRRKSNLRVPHEIRVCPFPLKVHALYPSKHHANSLPEKSRFTSMVKSSHLTGSYISCIFGLTIGCTCIICHFRALPFKIFRPLKINIQLLLSVRLGAFFCGMPQVCGTEVRKAALHFVSSF